MLHPTDLREDIADQDSHPNAATATPAASVADYDLARPVFAVPHPELGQRLIGREAALEQVRQQLDSGQRTAIVPAPALQGRGGLGTTRLAVEYAWRYRDLYPNGVVWLSADRDLDGQLADLAVKARWVAPESEHRFKLEIARHRLRSVADSLIVFDRLEDPATIRDYLPEPPASTPAGAPASPRMLIVSRTGQPDFVAVPIDLLDPGESLRMLIQEAGREPDGDAERDAAREIARTLEGLPLALELAGACLSQQAMGFQTYLEQLRQALGQTLPAGLARFSRHEANLYATLRIGASVVAQAPLLQTVLDVLAWSGPAPMGLDLLATLVGVEDSAELTVALELGTALHILRAVPGEDRYALPPLVRELRRAEVPIAERPDLAAERCARVSAWFGALLGNLPLLPRFEAELDHLRAWHGYAVQLAPKQAARLTWLQIYAPLQRGQPHEIRRLIEQGLAEYKQHGCDDQALLACLHHDLAFALDALGDPKRAQEQAGQALAIRRGLFGDDHPDTARSLGNLANYAAALDEPLRALELTEQTLAIRRAIHGDRHRDTAASLANIATFTYNLGNREHALDMASQALAIHRDLYGERHPDTVESLRSVAYYTNALGDTRRALELAEQALTIDRDLFGDRHPDTAMSLNAMATYASALGDHQRALELAQQALAIQHTLFGLRHPATAKCLHNIAGHLLKLGKTNEAHAHAQAAYDLFRQLLGAKHPQTLSTAKLLGGIKRPGFRIPSFKKGGSGKPAKPRK